MFGVHIGTDSFISESFYKGKILQRNYRKMTVSWSFFLNSFVKLHGKNVWKPQHDRVIFQFCYNWVCCKGTALYTELLITQTLIAENIILKLIQK